MNSKIRSDQFFTCFTLQHSTVYTFSTNIRRSHSKPSALTPESPVAFFSPCPSVFPLPTALRCYLPVFDVSSRAPCSSSARTFTIFFYISRLFPPRSIACPSMIIDLPPDRLFYLAFPLFLLLLCLLVLLTSRPLTPSPPR